MSTSVLKTLRGLRRLVFGNRPAPLIAYRLYDELAEGSWMKRRRWPVHDARSAGRRPFFVIGSGRSGTTFLRTSLCCNPRVVIPPESMVLGDAIRTYHRIAYREWPGVSDAVVNMFEGHPEFRAWGIELAPVRDRLRELDVAERNLSNIVEAIYGAYAAARKPGADLWGDKTPLNTGFLHWIDRLYPNARYVHLIRDGRDVVGSYVRTGLYSDVSAACERWITLVDKAMHFGRKKAGERYTEIRYERLVEDPPAVLRPLCTFLGIEFDEAMLEQHEIASDLGDVPMYPYHARVAQPVTTSRIGSWRDELDDAQVAYTTKRLRRMLDRLSYGP